jgi:hypothetical protein
MFRPTLKQIATLSTMALCLGFVTIGCGEGDIGEHSTAGAGAVIIYDTCGTNPALCEKGWLGDGIVDIHWGAPANPSSTHPKLYLAGPQDPTHPQETGNAAAGIPNHDHIVANQGPQILEIYVLQAGPNATSTNLKQRLDPAGTGLYMPYAVKLSGIWHNLTSSSTVRSAANAGILAVIDIGVAQNANVQTPLCGPVPCGF